MARIMRFRNAFPGFTFPPDRWRNKNSRKRSKQIIARLPTHLLSGQSISTFLPQIAPLWTHSLLDLNPPHFRPIEEQTFVAVHTRIELSCACNRKPALDNVHYQKYRFPHENGAFDCDQVRVLYH